MCPIASPESKHTLAVAAVFGLLNVLCMVGAVWLAGCGDAQSTRDASGGPGGLPGGAGDDGAPGEDGESGATALLDLDPLAPGEAYWCGSHPPGGAPGGRTSLMVAVAR